MCALISDTQGCYNSRTSALHMSMPKPQKHGSQSYTTKGHTLIQVVPPIKILLLSAHVWRHFYNRLANKNAYLHKETTIGYLEEEVPE